MGSSPIISSTETRETVVVSSKNPSNRYGSRGFCVETYEALSPQGISSTLQTVSSSLDFSKAFWASVSGKEWEMMGST